jgi:acyl dehydratase
MFKPQQTPFYDDIEVGYELPSPQLTLTVPIMVRWCAAAEIWWRDHYDKAYSVNHHLPNPIGSGSWSQAFLHAFVSSWAGPDGWVFKLSQRNRAPLFAGDVFTIWGCVTDKSTQHDLGYLQVDVGMRNQNGVEAVPAQATVVLPLRSGPPVPYPFKVPA